ncbi:MAG: hydrolase [Oscillospiraceae bacterium]
MEPTREQAWALLTAHNQEEFHLRHALTVESVMGFFARALGYEDDAAFWSMVGLLHDVDFEGWPEEHCVKAVALLSEAGFSEKFIHAVTSHGYGMTGAAAKPEHEMEQVLFAADELTGLVGAAALMRPSKSTKDMELKSLKKKFKDYKFAAGCSREVIIQGAQQLDWDLDKLLSMTLDAMKAGEDDIERALLSLPR